MKCINCNADIQNDTSRCPYCNFDLVKAKTLERNIGQVYNKVNKISKYISIIPVVIFVISAILIFVNFEDIVKSNDKPFANYEVEEEINLSNYFIDSIEKIVGDRKVNTAIKITQYQYKFNQDTPMLALVYENTITEEELQKYFNHLISQGYEKREYIPKGSTAEDTHTLLILQKEADFAMINISSDINEEGAYVVDMIYSVVDGNFTDYEAYF